MCLAAVAIGQSARFPWLLASNRDEFFDRPAAPLAWWQPADGGPAVLSGRDLSAGGTWLGLNAQGRLALVTNVREPGRTLPAAPSRGALVLQALQGGPVDFGALMTTPRNGFNLFTSELSRADGAQWFNNRPAQQRRLGAGVYGLSNAALDTPWPKVQHLKQRLGTALAAAERHQDRAALVRDLLQALADGTPADDAALPSTGVPLARERQLSSAFIRIVAPDSEATVYGTRCATVVVVERSAAGSTVFVLERSFGSHGHSPLDTTQQLLLPPPP